MSFKSETLECPQGFGPMRQSLAFGAAGTTELACFMRISFCTPGRCSQGLGTLSMVLGALRGIGPVWAQGSFLQGGAAPGGKRGSSLTGWQADGLATSMWPGEPEGLVEACSPCSVSADDQCGGQRDHRKSKEFSY